MHKQVIAMNTVSIRYIVDDVDAAIDFYTEHLDFDVLMHPAPGFAALTRGNLRLLLNAPRAGGAGQEMPDGQVPEPGGWNRIQLEVDDLAATVKRLREKGASFRNEVVSGKGGKQVLINDPAGNPVELFEPHHPATEPMSETDMQDMIQRTITAPVPPERAFSLFTSEMAAWWPREYTWAKDTLETIGIEPKEGGRCFERGPHGFECDWGRVIQWNPPHRLAFLWQISPTRAPEPNPERASEVEVRFEADGADATRVTLEHRGFSNHGEGAAEYRAAMDSARGWTYIMDRYQEATK